MTVESFEHWDELQKRGNELISVAQKSQEPLLLSAFEGQRCPISAGQRPKMQLSSGNWIPLLDIDEEVDLAQCPPSGLIVGEAVSGDDDMAKLDHDELPTFTVEDDVAVPVKKNIPGIDDDDGEDQVPQIFGQQ